ncbi:MAG: ABC transporter ATP-binding protein [Candidatus Obscuribacterales bacterium]
MIIIEDLSKSWDEGKTFSVNRLSLTVKKGEILVLLGSSGCGKSTTLKMINRLIDKTSGKIEVDGMDNQSIDIIALRRKIGYVFQKIGLFPHLSIVENVCIVPKLLGWDREKRLERARTLLDLVDLPMQTFGERLPRELSGGQQQRVGVARALAADPDYLLMDEPFGALDAVTRDSLQEEVLDLKHKLGKTIVFVTHDLFEALNLGDRIAVLHQGELQQCGPPGELVSNPATGFVKELFARPAKQLLQFKEVF